MSTAAATLLVPLIVSGQTATPDTAVRVTFGGFVDGYYAWDFGRPAAFDRSFIGGVPFTTQPARHNEFNVNLAFVEAKLDGAKVRGRLALQAGTSVQSNYSGEPANGIASGPLLARMIQEAVAGVKASDTMWIDAGIFYSHMGLESWASRDNMTYTRSLVAEYSPYYSSGVKAVWTATPKLTAQFHLVNGWQNISENNTGKGAGLRLDYAGTATTTATYYNFFSDEAGNRLRMFNGVGLKTLVGKATLMGQFDLGSQAKSSATGGTATWWGYSAMARLPLTGTVALATRVERFDDKNQVIVGTGSTGSPSTANGAFQANGGSIGLDWSPQSRVLWRTELRGFGNNTSIFPDGASGTKKSSAFVVSSLALTF